jgi:hypothetical protein
LDFDEGEAFLAIVSVSAFACLLIEQISERIAFLRSKEDAEASKASIRKRMASHKGDLLERTVNLLKEFARLRHDSGSTLPRISGRQLMAALLGFLESASPDLHVASEVPLDVDHRVRADFVVSDDESKLIIEVKGALSRSRTYDGIVQLEQYMDLSGIRLGVLFFYPYGYELEQHEPIVRQGRLVVLSRKSAPNPDPSADG